MANRRMFAKSIIRTDAFLDMPPTAQNLYFHLGLEADDDGFVTPKVVMRMLGSGIDDLKLLIGKKFVIPFEESVLVITHWKIHNEIRVDRYKQTIYQDLKNKLSLNDGIYTLGSTSGSTDGRRSIGEDSIDKDSIDSGLPQDFSLEEEIKKLEESPRRELNIEALYFDKRRPDIQNKAQLSVAVKRHLRAAIDLKPFTDNQIIDAIPKAKQLTDGWTLETLVKVLTK